VPAAVVISALRVYLKVAAVKKPIADFIGIEMYNQLSNQLVKI
jgi:hypothetical protein